MRSRICHQSINYSNIGETRVVGRRDSTYVKVRDGERGGGRKKSCGGQDIEGGNRQVKSGGRANAN